MSLNSSKEEDQSAAGADLIDSSAIERKAPYEPPTVRRVGDLHELLAGGAGSAVEMQDPFAGKRMGDPG